MGHLALTQANAPASKIFLCPFFHVSKNQPSDSGSGSASSLPIAATGFSLISMNGYILRVARRLSSFAAFLIAARSGAMIIWRELSLADPVFSVVISILIIFSS
jgi:hypothetical protein